MPRFYFDISPGAGTADLTDDEGEELADLDAARINAVRLSGEILKDYPDRFWSNGEWSCTVRDENRLLLFVLRFYATDAPPSGGPPA